jgi:hypothetical protein
METNPASHEDIEDWTDVWQKAAGGSSTFIVSNPRAIQTCRDPLSLLTERVPAADMTNNGLPATSTIFGESRTLPAASKKEHLEVLMRVLTAIGIILIIAASASAQNETIRDQLRKNDEPMINMHNGPPLWDRDYTLKDVVDMSDLIVRGRLGAGKSYLSKDETRVYTDYPILNPQVLYSAFTTEASRPGVAVTLVLTQLGGIVEIDGKTFREGHAALKQLPSGLQGIFFLKRVGDQYRIAGNYLGVFQEQADGVTVRMDSEAGLGQKYNGLPVSQFLGEAMTDAQEKEQSKK